jgi:hypothetical protein
MDLTTTLKMCRFMVSWMHLAETDGAVWLFPAASGAATLVGVIHLTRPLRPCPRRACSGWCVRAGHLVARLRTGRTPRPLLRCCSPAESGRVLEIAGVIGEAWRFLDVGPSPAVEGGLMHLA